MQWTSTERKVVPGPGWISGPESWYGETLEQDSSWVHEFSDEEIEELLAALHSIRKSDLRYIGRGDFRLPTLGSTLDRIRADLIRGRGFVLFRGFPVDRTSREDAARAFWGISQYLGKAVPQNLEGHLIGHVIDLGADVTDPYARIYATNRYHRFHTDSVDIVGLLCLHPAKRGGVSSLVSSATIYNEMTVTHPALAGELFRPFPVARKGEIPVGKDAFYSMPIFHWHEELLSAIFSRDFIEASQHYPDAPRLTRSQIEAMNVLEQLCADPKLRLDVELQQGDMQFLHNHQIFHSRSRYEDWPEPNRKRHLLRIWLCPPDGRALPAVFEERYGSVEIGNRGGIVLPDITPSVPISTIPRPWWMSE